MKKILFVMPSLDSGGAEKSLVNLLNIIDYKKYNIDLLLLKQEGLIVDMTSKAVSDGVMMLRKDNELYNSIQNYLKEHEYGNEKEILRYYKLLEK